MSSHSQAPDTTSGRPLPTRMPNPAFTVWRLLQEATKVNSIWSMLTGDEESQLVINLICIPWSREYEVSPLTSVFQAKSYQFLQDWV